MVYSTKLLCPQCHQIDRIQKVSALVEAGTLTGTHRGYSSGSGFSSNGPVYIDESIILHSNIQTNLGRLLSPPKQPKGDNKVAILIMWLVGIAFLMLLIGSKIYYDSVIASIAYCIGAICIVATILTPVVLRKQIRSSQRLYLESYSQWQKAIGKWQHLFYCHRCDFVFLPGLPHLVPPTRMGDFLYDDTI